MNKNEHTYHRLSHLNIAAIIAIAFKKIEENVINTLFVFTKQAAKEIASWIVCSGFSPKSSKATVVFKVDPNWIKCGSYAFKAITTNSKATVSSYSKVPKHSAAQLAVSEEDERTGFSFGEGV